MEAVKELFDKIVVMLDDDNIVISRNDEFNKLKEIYNNSDDELKKIIVCEMEKNLQHASIFKGIYLYTFLINVTGENRYVSDLIDITQKCDYMKLETKYFIYNQIKSMGFLGKYDDDTYCKAKIQKLFECIVNEYKKKITQSLKFIPGNERNSNLVIVVTEQFLSDKHGPTKSALGRCIALKKMGKEVMLINTAELMSKTGGFPTFEVKLGSYAEDFVEYNQVEWKGVAIPFFQCDNNMPDLETIDYLLSVIRNLKPAYVIAIGGDGVFVSLVSEMVPTLAVSMVPSKIATTTCTFQTLGRALNNEDKEYLGLIKRDEGRIIEHKFTSDLIEQSSVKTKEEIGIASDKFVIAVAGARLDIEMTDEFICMMEKAVKKDENIEFMILGRYSGADKMKEKHPELYKHVKFMGFVNDILAYYEASDIYVNPIRVGGGTSSVEALSKGIPVITTNYGDVAVNVGEDYFTSDYDTMVEDILRYKNDPEFYCTQSSKAIKRAEDLLDTEKAFKELVDEFLERAQCIEDASWTESHIKKVYNCEYNLLDSADCERLRVQREGKEAPNNPKISFMMCTYNDASLLNIAINSLLRQEYENWELIIWDNSDKSDEPWIIIENVMRADNRIRGYRNGKSYGWPKGASLCMEKVRGEYTTFLASDDCINIDAIQKVVKVLDEKNPDILWVSAVGTQYNGNDNVTINSAILNEYKEYGSISRSDNIVNIMQSTYYNSFFHYMKVEFLRKNNINFFEPYYADCGGMTRALANAEVMISIPDVVYYLTNNTSQTKGRYTWGSVEFEFGRQWESVKETFASEGYTNKDNISYVAKRIMNNIIANIQTMLSGSCRDKYMNPITKNRDEILQQLESIFENRNIAEMLVLAGKEFRKKLYDIINVYINVEETAFEDEPVLKCISNISKNIEANNIEDLVKSMIELLLCKENAVFLGFEYFAELLEQCSDEIVTANQKGIEKVIEEYSAFLNNNNGEVVEKWYISQLN